MRTVVYLAGPISLGTPSHNVHRAIQVADAILAADIAVVAPQLSLLWDVVSPKPYETWMRLDFALLARCDALFRLEGESRGADREVEHATRLRIPVFYEHDGGVPRLEAWARERERGGA
jgi:nucleoside 2-deoxyribosyltransferase